MYLEVILEITIKGKKKKPSNVRWERKSEQFFKVMRNVIKMYDSQEQYSNILGWLAIRIILMIRVKVKCQHL